MPRAVMPVATNKAASIYYEETGSGEALVLTPSFLCSGQMWRGQVPALERGYRVINIDLRGHGHSGPANRRYSLYDLVSDVIAVLDQLGVERAIWCGLSVGGMIALRAALVYPKRVSSLVLVDTDAGAEASWRKLKYRAMGAGSRLLGVRPLATPITRQMFGRSTRASNPALIREWKRGLDNLHIPSVLRMLDAIVERDSLLSRLSKIRVPTLILVGEEDRVLPPAMSRRMQERIAQARLQLIAQAGHLCALEQPETVTQAIMTFLDTGRGQRQPASS
jgi:3-oxoadipate enol-lactonase